MHSLFLINAWDLEQGAIIATHIHVYKCNVVFFSFCIQVHIRSIQMPESMHVSSIVDEKRKNKVYIYIYI